MFPVATLDALNLKQNTENDSFSFYVEQFTFNIVYVNHTNKEPNSTGAKHCTVSISCSRFIFECAWDKEEFPGIPIVQNNINYMCMTIGITTIKCYVSKLSHLPGKSWPVSIIRPVGFHFLELWLLQVCMSIQSDSLSS